MNIAALVCLVAAQQAPSDQPLPPFELGRTAGVSIADDGRPLAVGPDWIATFDERGATFVPALGNRAPRRQDLVLEARELRRGSAVVALTDDEPQARGDTVVFERAPGVEERFEATLAGLEHSLLVAGPVGSDGDLVVRVDLGGEVGAAGTRRSDGSHRFGVEHGGVSYGRLFGIDANGTRCDGDVRLVPGGLELVLPATFVDSAAWPILLDPVVGSIFGISDPAPGSPTFAEADSNPVVAFDDSTNNYMAVWERRFAANSDVRVFYQRFDSNGQPVGSFFAVSTSTLAYEPRVVNLNDVDRFAISWIQELGGVKELRLRTSPAVPGSLSNTLILADSTSSTFDHDLAGEMVVGSGVKARAFAVWNDTTAGIQLARVLVPSAADIFVESTTTVAADPGLFDSLNTPRISRSTSSNGRLGVAWVRDNGLANTEKAYATVIDRTGAVLHTPQLVSGTNDSVRGLDIDGGGANPTRFVVAWPEQLPVLLANMYVAALSSESALSAAPPVLASTKLSFLNLWVSVGWRSGSAFALFNDGGTVREQRIDPVTGTTVGSATALFASDSSLPPLLFSYQNAEICMNASGGDAQEAGGVVVTQALVTNQSNPGVSIVEKITGRFVTAFSPGATVVDLGGGCGNVGTIAVPQPPAIGNGTFSIRIDASPSATFAVLNIAAPQALQSCGACDFALPGTTFLVQIVSQSTTVNLPVPANAALAGAQALAQWFVFTPGDAPCGLVPDFSASNLVELTLN
jgi:hypothetical protein